MRDLLLPICIGKKRATSHDVFRSSALEIRFIDRHETPTPCCGVFNASTFGHTSSSVPWKISARRRLNR